MVSGSIFPGRSEPQNKRRDDGKQRSHHDSLTHLFHLHPTLLHSIYSLASRSHNLPYLLEEIIITFDGLRRPCGNDGLKLPQWCYDWYCGRCVNLHHFYFQAETWTVCRRQSRPRRRRPLSTICEQSLHLLDLSLKKPGQRRALSLPRKKP